MEESSLNNEFDTLTAKMRGNVEIIKSDGKDEAMGKEISRIFCWIKTAAQAFKEHTHAAL